MNYLVIDQSSSISYAFTADSMHDAKETISRDGQAWYDDGSDDLDVPLGGDLAAAAEDQGWHFTQIHDGWEVWKGGAV